MPAVCGVLSAAASATDALPMGIQAQMLHTLAARSMLPLQQGRRGTHLHAHGAFALDAAERGDGLKVDARER